MTLSYDIPGYPNFTTYQKSFQNLKVMKRSYIKIAVPSISASKDSHFVPK